MIEFHTQMTVERDSLGRRTSQGASNHMGGFGTKVIKKQKKNMGEELERWISRTRSVDQSSPYPCFVAQQNDLWESHIFM